MKAPVHMEAYGWQPQACSHDKWFQLIASRLCDGAGHQARVRSAHVATFRVPPAPSNHTTRPSQLAATDIYRRK